MTPANPQAPKFDQEDNLGSSLLKSAAGSRGSKVADLQACGQEQRMGTAADVAAAVCWRAVSLWGAALQVGGCTAR